MTSVSINNFQSIKSLDLEISGFTVIVGASDIGKSAIRRAIDFPLTNNWDKGYVRNGEKDVDITIEKDNLSIRRVKGKSNLTVINGITYEKSGTTVPLEYKDFGIKPLTTVDGEYNILVSSQLDRLFLSSFSDNDQHKVLNAILETAKYEEALRFVNNDINVLAKQSRDNQEQIDISLSTIQQYETVVSILEKVQSLSSQQQLLIQYADTLSKIDGVSKKHDLLATTIESAKKVQISLELALNLDKMYIATGKHMVTSDALKNINAILMLHEFKKVSDGGSSVSSVIFTIDAMRGSINLLIMDKYNELINTTNAKLFKATTVDLVLSSTIGIMEEKYTLENHKLLVSKDNDNICKSTAIQSMLQLIDSQQKLKQLQDLQEGLSYLAERNISWENEQVSVDNELASLEEQHKCELEEEICPTCGQSTKELF